MTKNYKHAIEMLKAFEAGQLETACEGEDGDHWEKIDSLEEPYVELMNNPKYYRRKPTKRMVAWGPEDVRPGMVFRHDGARTFYAFYSAGIRGIQLSRAEDVIAYPKLMSEWQYSLDGIAWAKCGKEEVVS